MSKKLALEEEKRLLRIKRKREQKIAVEHYIANYFNNDFESFLDDFGERGELLAIPEYCIDRAKCREEMLAACATLGVTDFLKSLEYVRGQNGYNKLFLGPPGTGKTMLASRLCDLLPEMNVEEAMETASVASLTQSEINEHNWKTRPFRAPHHSSSMAALVGGGSVPRPGEISLAHNGLLFLDEMAVILILISYQIRSNIMIFKVFFEKLHLKLY